VRHIRLLPLIAIVLLGHPAASAQRGELRVLFIGNSLTSVNDLPRMVERIAGEAGWKGRIRCEAVTRDDSSLEDHWNGGEAVKAIRSGRWTHVVLQQGPSSLPSSQAMLREYTAKFAAEIRARGAAVVLYGVWPPRDRLPFQPAVTDAYRSAAADVGGRVVPVGEGWAAAWRRDPSLPLYAADGFHPSSAGTHLAALMLAEAVTGENLDRLAPPRRRAVAPAGVDDLQLETIHTAVAATRPSPAVPSIAITIDDLPTISVLGDEIERAERTTRELLAALRRAEVPAIGFVNEGKLQPSGTIEPRRVALLQQWIDAGFDLGNHTFSHIDLHRSEVAAFERNVTAGDHTIRRLLASVGREPRYFRHPFLHTGQSREVRDRIDALLSKHGYVVAPVTLDNSDYMFAAAYDRAGAAADTGLVGRIEAAYLDYMDAVVRYYEEQSLAIVGRPMAHTLLLHANALNAATVERLVSGLRTRGYAFVTLDDALKDPAYRLADDYFGPAGMTWLHRWALTADKRGNFAGEPAVPEWITKAANGG